MNGLRSSALKRISITHLVVIFSMLAFAVPSNAQKQPALVAPHPLITQPVDETHLSVLKGNTHPFARPEFDLGTAPATLPMQRMLLVLKRSPDQESRLRQLLDNQQDKSSPSYHQWLTPAEYGKQFGPTEADMQTITAWLQSHGFVVGSTKGRTVLEFSGSASQVQEAFHTTIHKYIVNGEQHWANATDPQIPAALTPGSCQGIATLHNFLKKPQLHMVKQPASGRILPGKKPQVTFPAQNGKPAINALGPPDYAVIYNINPTYNSGISGQGVTIGVVARSNLWVNPGLGLPGEDISSFQALFNLPIMYPTIVLNGPDPGDLGGGEEAEATLDSTWPRAVASFANVDLVVSATTNTTDGVDLSELYIVENNLADVMTESFSACELLATDVQLAFTYGLAEQAAAQGITYFVSTGDNGAEGCDDPSKPPAKHPISVNLLASTPFNVAVGGTMFNENGQTNKYWGTEPPVQESAISYIPEDAWNESGPTKGLWAGSGGASAGNIQNGLGGTTPGIPKPSWQSGVTGIPDDLARDLPDVSLSAAGHDPYLLCLEGSCFPNSQGQFFIYFISGTSASAPSFAGIMALVDQQMVNLNPAQGPRQGQANYVLYRLAASQNANPSQCDASDTTTPPAGTCVFNDVTVGNNVVPGEEGTQYQATPGYDQTTGLGSVNVANLVNQWNSVTFNPTTTTLSISQSPITHGSSVNFTVVVSPTSGNGIPTGEVSLLTSPPGQVIFNYGVGAFSLDAAGSVSSSTSDLPGGAALLEAHYAGDSTYAPSDSNWSPLDVAPEPSSTTSAVFSLNSQGGQVTFTNGAFGSLVYLGADVAGMSGHGTPTGTVTFLDNGSPITGASSLLLSNQGITATPSGISSFDAGTHAISANYSGDGSFLPSTTTQSQSFTIAPGFLAMVPGYAVNPLVISTPGSPGQTAVNVTASTGFNGTITLSCSKLPAGAACQFAQPSIVSTGTLKTTTDTITVTTTASSALLRSPQYRYLADCLAVGSLMFASIILIAGPRRRSPPLFLIALSAIIMVTPACGGGGGGSSNTGPPPPSPTPAGTYTVVVSASSGAVTSTTSFTLIVQ